jgi:hypothetical protein
MSSSYTGGCACSAIRYEIGAEPLAAAQCHCRDCQRASGCGHANILLFERSKVAVTGSPTYYEAVADSGHMVARGFCDRCGSQVFTQPRRFSDRMGVTAGSLDDPEKFRPTIVVWTSRAPNWDRVDQALPSFPGNPHRR